MPIFKRYKIDRYKEVMTNQSTGLIQDGVLSTYTFDNESNGDFVGIVKDIRLIGEVIEMTMDTGRFSVNQINNTTQLDFDQLVSNGTIRITERPLGWTEIAKTRASFYYEECSPTSFVRKRPVSEHYYDFSTFAFGTSLVAGSGPQDTDIQYSVGEDALRPIGTFDPNIGNNMGVFGPRFNQMDLQSYMRMVINSTISQGQGFIQNQQGEFRSVNGWSPLDGEILRQIQLYLSNINEHFNNPNSQTVSSGKYGRTRDVIQEGFRASSYIGVDFSKTTGQCLETTISSTSTSVTPTTGGEMPTSGGGVSINNDSSYMPTDQDLELLKSSIESTLKSFPRFKYKDKSTERTQAGEITSIIISPDPNLYPEVLQLSQFSFYDLHQASQTIDSIFEEIEKIARQRSIPDIIALADGIDDIQLTSGFTG
jgi:hypothetical protein